MAWKPAEDEAVAQLLNTYRFGGIELTPTKVWPDLAKVTEVEVKAYRDFWNNHGVQIVAMQALLFGRDDLTIFGSEAKRQEGIEYFKSIFQIAQWLGAHALIYGSPKHRRNVDPSDGSIRKIAQRYFKSLGALAGQQGICLCIEPLPRNYPCDFINDSSDALQFIEEVQEKGFGLHLDASSLFQGGENVPQTLEDARGRIKHFHASEPQLAPVLPEGPVPIREYIALLDRINYSNWVSIEMLEPQPSGSNISVIEKALQYLRHSADLASLR